jgi:hypothetical protein
MEKALRYRASLTLSIVGFSFFAGKNVMAGLCSKNEETVFNCITGTHVASICVSITPNKDGDFMQYRFGTKASVEFQFPNSKANYENPFLLSSTSFGGGGESHLRFTNDNYEYIVYERTTKGKSDMNGIRPSIFGSGIFVKKDGKRLKEYKCADAENSGISSFVYDSLPREAFKQIREH